MDLKKTGITIIEVTKKEKYLIPTDDQEKVKKLVDEWFSEQYVNSYHAFRDANKIGCSEEFISHEVIQIIKRES